MARRSNFVAGDPVTGALLGDREDLAEQVAEALEQFGDAEQGRLKGLLYKIPVPNGKYEWIKDVYPPFDISDIMKDLKEQLGGGDYALRLMVEGKVGVRRTFHFSIMKDKTDPQAAPRRDDSANMGLFQMMMAQQADARRESQAAADRQMQVLQQTNQATMQMFTAMSQQTMAMMTAMMSSREKASDLLPLFAAMQPAQNPMKDTVETIAAIQGLFPKAEGGGGFDADDLVGSAVRLAGPVLSAVGRAVQNRQGQPPAEGAPEGPPAPLAPLTLPGGAPAPTPALAAPADAVSRILTLVGDDVLFMFGRGYDPSIAAEAVYARIEDAGIGEGELNDLVGAFAASPDWLADLAGRGIDLRRDRQWADEFLQALVGLHAGAVPGGLDDHSGGRAGGEVDAQDDGAARAGGIAPN